MNKAKIQFNKLAILSLLTALLLLWSFEPAYANQSNSVQAVNTEGFITIDGYYDDWEDMPMGSLTWNSNNGEAHHDVAFIKDDNYIYIYVRMHPHYQSPIPIYAINLTVNNKTCQLFLAYADDKGSTDWNKQVTLNNNGQYLKLHPFTYYPNYSLGDAAITISEGSPNDRMEIRINISSLENVMNLKKGTINSGSQLQLNMPNIGAGSIQLLGTSTGSFLGIALCIVVVAAVWLYRTYKKRLHS